MKSEVLKVLVLFWLMVMTLFPLIGASFNGVTVTLKDSVNEFTLGEILLPLSVTVQVMLAGVLLLALATVLYIKPCNSVSDNVSLLFTWVVPPVFHKVMEEGIPVIL